nr:hypothetical protein [Tanacetum cinerariifolium]
MGTTPKCIACGYYHLPETPFRFCFKCNRLGHFTKDYRVAPRNVNHINARNLVVRTYFECGSTDHIKSVYPRINQAQRLGGNLQNQVMAVNWDQGHGNQGNQARGRALTLGAKEARQDPNIMTDIEPSDLGFSYEIEIASVQLVEIDKVIKGCKLEIDGHVFDVNLIPFGSGSFDVIIGMDWLSDHKSDIIFHEKVVMIPLLDGKTLSSQTKFSLSGFGFYPRLLTPYSRLRDKDLQESKDPQVVILNGDSPIPTRVIDGVVQHVAPNTAEQMLAKKNELKARDTLSDAVIYSFFASQSNNPQLDNDDLKQIDADDLEEINLKSQMAMLTMRARRFLQRTGRNLGANGTTSIGFDMLKVECYNCHRRRHFARDCRSPKDNSYKETQNWNVLVETSTSNALGSQCDGVGSYDWSFQAEEEPTNYALTEFTSSSSSSSDNKTSLESVKARILVYQQSKTVFEEDIKLLKLDVQLRDNALVKLMKKFEKTEQERDELKLKLENFQTSSKNLSQLLASQTNDKTGLSYDNKVFNSSVVDSDEMFSSESDVSMSASPAYDRYKSGEGYHVVPPPYTGTFMQPKPNLVFHDDPIINETIPTAFNGEPMTAQKAPSFVQTSKHVKSPRPYVKSVKHSILAANLKTDILNPKGHGNNRNGKACFVCKSLTHLIKDYDYYEKKMVQKLVRNHAMRGNMSYLFDFKEINGGYVVFGGNPKGGKITGKGKIRTGKLDFDDVYFVKELKFKLFSVSHMCDKKNNVLFIDTKCVVLSSNFKLPDENHVLLRVPRENNMYNVDLKKIVSLEDLTCLLAKATLDDSNLWHRRLGHINFKTINKLVKGNLVRGLPSKVFENNYTCVACKKGNQHRASCKSKPVSFVSQPLQRLHMDLFGPTFAKSLNIKSYCLVVTDDYSRFSWVFFLATKDETSPILKTFITGIENQLSLKVKIIRSDNGTKFKNQDLNQFYGMKGIKREFSVTRTPQHNGIAKRKNRTLIEAARTMLADLLLPIPFWAEEFLVGYSASSKAFRVFSSRTRIVQETLNINFLENHPNVAGSGPTWLFDIDTLTKFMNYQPVTAGNQPNLSTGIQEHFDADKVGEGNVQQYVLFPLWSSSSKDPQNTNDDTTFEVKEPEFEVKELESEVHVSPSSSVKIKKHNDKTKREAKGKILVNAANTLVPAVGQISTNNTNTFSVAGPSNTTVSPTHGKSLYVDPSQYPDDLNMTALEDITYSDDEEAVGAEADFSNLETNITVSPILTTRVHKDHQVTQIIGDLSSAPQTRSMIRMVKEQGHTQEEGIDYEEVFAPVARIKAIRLFLAYSCFMGFMAYQMDVKSAFLYGTIKEEVYVYQPPGFEDLDYPDKVYQVVKGHYGLDQAPRAWYETLANYLLENGYQRGKIDQTLFIKKQKVDILLVQQKEDGIFISQDKYVAEILRKFGLTDGKSASTPIDTEKHLLKDPNGEDVDVHTYRSMIGSLMYLTSSRLDIMFAVCTCAHFQVTPKASHLHVVKRIFRYFKGKPHLGLWYPKDSPFNVVAYSDSDYDGASLDRKSTIGGCQFLGCRLIYWQCKKQTVVTTSSTEAKYVAAASCCAQVLGIQNQLLDYGYNFMYTTIYIDNGSTISIDCLPNEEIFAELARMGYEKPSTKLTFYKAFFSPQWKFLIHTILQCMSAKRTAWNEYSSSMASAVICLATGRKFNFSMYIFNSLVRNVDSSSKFYMYLRFLQLMIAAQVGDLTSHTTKYTSPALAQKVFVNMRRVGKGFSRVNTPLFEGMLVQQKAADDVDDVVIDNVLANDVADVVADDVVYAASKPTLPSPTPAITPPPSQELPSTSQVSPTPPPSPHQSLQQQQPSSPPQQPQPLHTTTISVELLNNMLETCTALTMRVENLEQDKIAQALEITKLKQRGQEIGEEEEVESFRIEKIKEALIDVDKDVTLEEVDATKDAKVAKDADDDGLESAKLKNVIEVVTTANIITEVVTDVATPITTATITAAPSAARRRKRVVIRDPKETATPSTIVHSELKSKDKGKFILVEEPKPLKKKA